jgi:hypothetical protein
VQAKVVTTILFNFLLRLQKSCGLKMQWPLVPQQAFVPYLMHVFFNLTIIFENRSLPHFAGFIKISNLIACEPTYIKDASCKAFQASPWVG